MIPRFALVRPRTLSEAFHAYAATGGDAAWYAGGTELLQVMKMGLAHIGTLIDLKELPDLRGIEQEETTGALRIGAATTHREVERSALVLSECPGLAGLERAVANARVRNTGTIGGNLAFAEPHSDPATFLVACGASVSLVGPGGTRNVPMDEFLLGPFSTIRDPEEILTHVLIPAAKAKEGRAYEKVKFLERPAVSVAVRLEIDGERVKSAQVVVGSATDTPTRAQGAGDALVGAPLHATGFAAAVAAAGSRLQMEVEAMPDMNGSADFKLAMAAGLLRTAATSALKEAASHA